MKTSLIVPRNIVEETIQALQEAGRLGSERVVLWLGQRTDISVLISKCYVPAQEADRDFFSIPRHAMRDLLRYLGTHGLMIGAQVHSHPEEAFHSQADDRWAIIRHAGALSLVLPVFASETNVNTFVRDAAVFELQPNNRWRELSGEEIPEQYQIE